MVLILPVTAKHTDEAETVQLRIDMKGCKEPITISGSPHEIECVFKSLSRHVRDYGFKGWRRFGGLLVNMAEVQAIWIEGVS